MVSNCIIRFQIYEQKAAKINLIRSFFINIFKPCEYIMIFEGAIRSQVGFYTFSGMNTSVAYVFLICGHLSLSDISLRITINEFVPCILTIHCKYFFSLIEIFIYTDKYTNSLHRVFMGPFVQFLLEKCNLNVQTFR